MVKQEERKNSDVYSAFLYLTSLASFSLQGYTLEANCAGVCTVTMVAIAVGISNTAWRTLASQLIAVVTVAVQVITLLATSLYYSFPLVKIEML